MEDCTCVFLLLLSLLLTANGAKDEPNKRISRQTMDGGTEELVHSADDDAVYHYQVDNPRFEVKKDGYLYPNVDNLGLTSKPEQNDMFISIVNGQTKKQKRVHVSLISQDNNIWPTFTSPDYACAVFETANTSTSITRVQATDGDGDRLTFRFNTTGAPQEDRMFRLNRNTGEITLQNEPFDFGEAMYFLTVIVEDGRGGMDAATVKVEVVFVNSYKPEFRNCSSYSPSVKENEPLDTFVIQVQAEDQDRGLDGEVTYDLLQATSADVYFSIDKDTGVITTNAVFDRDEPINQKWFDVTVKATDKGRIQYDTVCIFRVEVLDVNDNGPDYGRNKIFEADVTVGMTPGQTVLRIQANDMDADDNGRITYSMISDRERKGSELLRINPENGVVQLNKAVTEDMLGELTYVVNASDNGQPQRFSSIGLQVNIIGSSKAPPIIQDFNSSPIQLSESTTDFSTPISSFKVRSNTVSPDVLANMVAGTTEQTNKGDTFRLEKSAANHDGWIDVNVYLAKSLDFEKIKKYWITIEVKNRDGVKENRVLTVEVLDANDESPVFAPVEKATILENSTSGSVVLTVKASDADTVPEYKQVSYELPNEEDRYRFEINRQTGELTTMKVFDYEANEQSFFVSVLAQDGAVSSRGTGKPNQKTYDVEVVIQDINDNPPFFKKTEYTGSITEAADVGDLVIRVDADDLDKSSQLVYSIDSQTPDDGFTVEPMTGDIKVARPLDYDGLKHDPKYHLRLVVSDGRYRSEALVIITIENANDMHPLFESSRYESDTVRENTTTDLPKYLLQVQATDPDRLPGEDQQIRYYLDKTPTASYFRIGMHDGKLEAIRALDHDPPTGSEIWTVRVVAIDEDGKGLKNTTNVHVPVEDINDNAPYIKTPGPFYIVETNGERADALTLHQNITFPVKDNDGRYNGPPFSASIDPSTDLDRIFQLRESPTINHQLREQDIFLTTSYSFDRETQKMYLVPIVLVDSGTTPQDYGSSDARLTGTSTLTVVVRDINDNPMSDGSNKVSIFNFEGKMPDAEIGRVYVTDADDWDLPDKRFSWASGYATAGFKLNHDTGMVTMLQGTPVKDYNLSFKVVDVSRNETASSSMAVNVRLITEEAVKKSASLRLTGITQEEFIQKNNGKSLYDSFTEKIGTLVNTSVDNVEVFSVRDVEHVGGEQAVEVRFAAHGSPYYYPEWLEYLLMENKDEVERDVGIDIIMINADACYMEGDACETSCYSELRYDGNRPYLVQTNHTSLVTVYTQEVAVCECLGMEPPSTCPEDFCLNGGRCFSDGKTARCECPEHYGGPRCELLDAGFNGDSFAWFESLTACNESIITITFSTLEDGLLFYNGPMKKLSMDTNKDYIAVEIVKGIINFYLNLGEEDTFLFTFNPSIADTDIKDGKQHTLAISWDLEALSVEILDEDCEASGCHNIYMLPDVIKMRVLNVNTPLQVGGVLRRPSLLSSYDNAPKLDGFNGCISNVTFNGKTLNFGEVSHSQGLTAPCRGLHMGALAEIGTNNSFIIAICACVVTLLLLILLLVFCRRRAYEVEAGETDDIRENIISYEDEGGGEKDAGFDISVLRVTPDGKPLGLYPGMDHGTYDTRAPTDTEHDIEDFLAHHKEAADQTDDMGPEDVRHYAFEGTGSDAGSLSSLSSGSSADHDQDWDYLAHLGPPFQKLADMYGGGESDSEPEFTHSVNQESFC